MRLAACMNVPVDVIGPAGFDLSDRALKRAALDYLPYVDLTRHLNWDEFLAKRVSTEGAGRLVLLSARGDLPYAEFRFEPDDTLLLGRETAGVPDSVRAVADASVRVPMRRGLRSLNVAVAAAMVLGEALRQTGLFP
jgi:tRNA (cytidine/uridine-2'-O-)-methyltransferase